MEEYFYELTRAIGAMYTASADALGSVDTPGSALFETNQLAQTVLHDTVYFGILTSNPAGLQPTYDTGNPYYVAFSQGTLAYNGQTIVVPPQQVSIKKNFLDVYSPASSYQYCVRVGFPLSEAQRTLQSQSTTVSTAVSSGSNTIPVANATVATTLGFPLSAHVGYTFVTFSGVTADGTALLIDPGYDNGQGATTDSTRYGQLATSIPLGAPVRFIYEPKLRAIYSMPVTGSGITTTNPSLFHYKPPMPSDWLPVADILVTNPSNPGVTPDGSGGYAILSTAQFWPAPDAADPMYLPADATTFSKATSAAIKEFRQATEELIVNDLVAALEDYTNDQADRGQLNFVGYWAARPFEPKSYFVRGSSFDGLERFEFDRNFSRAYFATRGADVRHTFALFRGDLYSQGSTSSGSAPSPIQIESWAAKNVFGGPTPLLARGTYTYGVTGVDSSGETAATYASISADGIPGSVYLNTVDFGQVTNANYYQVYRQANQVGAQADYRLTTPNQVTGYGAATWPTGTFSFRLMSTPKIAYRFLADGPTLSAIGVAFKSEGAITNGTDKLTFSIYTDNSGVPSASPVASTFAQIPFSSLTPSGARQLVAASAGPTLAPGQYYWIVVSTTSAPIGGDVLFSAASSADTNSLATFNGTSWSATSGVTPLFKPYYGFLDGGVTGTAITERGVKLTGDVALKPARLRVYVPPISGNVSAGFEPGISTQAGAVEDTRTQNELRVTVVARNGATGSPTTVTTTVPQYSIRGTSLLLGGTSSVFDRIDSVQVTPGSSLTTVSGSTNTIKWSLYDFITVETVV